MGNTLPVKNRVAVAIVGGGPAGAALALTLAGRGLRDLVMIDPGRGDAPRIGESLPPGATPLLMKLGVWDAFQAQGHLPCPGSVSVWGHDNPGFNDFLFDPLGPGWHLDRPRFDRLMQDTARDRGCQLLGGVRLTGISPPEAVDGETSPQSSQNTGPGIGQKSGQDFELELSDAGGNKSRIAAGFVVDASGPGSSLARRLGVARNIVDELLALWCLAEIDRPEALPDRTLVEATDYGWWYAARVPGDRMVLSLTTDARTRKERDLANADRWLEALKGTSWLFPALSEAGIRPEPLATAAISSGILSCVAGPGWLAAGDAGSSWDPVTSQGIFKALTDGIEAGEAIAARLEGDEGAISGYQDAVFTRFNSYLGVRDSLYRREQRWPGAGFWQRRP